MATLRDIIVRVRADTSDLQRNLGKASSSVSKFGRGMTSTGKTLTRNVSLPLVAIGAASVKMAYDFDQSFTNIRALVGASEKDIKGYQKAVLAMAGETAQAPKDLADALYFVTSSGFKGAEALSVLRASAKAAAAGLGETKTVADAVTSAVNAYGIANLKAGAAADVLVAAVREGKGEASELAGAIGRVIPIAAQLNVSFQDVGGALSSMTLSGLDAAEATTALRGIFTSLLKPTADGVKALKDVGLNVATVRDNLSKHGLIETLIDLKQRFGDNNEAIADMFPNVRALAGFLNLTGKNAEKNVGIFARLRDSVGDTNAAFKEASKSDVFKFKKALNDLRVEGIKLGKQLIPIITNDIIPAVRKLVNWWKDLSPASKDLALKLAGLAILAGPLLRLAGSLTSVAGGVMKLFGAGAGTAGAAAAAGGGGLAATLAGIAAPVAGVATLSTVPGDTAAWDKQVGAVQKYVKLLDDVARSQKVMFMADNSPFVANLRNLAESYPDLISQEGSFKTVLGEINTLLADGTITQSEYNAALDILGPAAKEADRNLRLYRAATKAANTADAVRATGLDDLVTHMDAEADASKRVTDLKLAGKKGTEAYKNAVLAEIATNKILNGDLALLGAAIGDVSKLTGAQKDALYALGAQFGLTRGQIDALLRKLDKLRNTKPVHVQVYTDFYTAVHGPVGGDSKGNTGPQGQPAPVFGATGGRIVRGGRINVGEQGPETVYLPKGAQIDPHKGGTKGGGPMRVTITDSNLGVVMHGVIEEDLADGRVVEDALTTAMIRRMEP